MAVARIWIACIWFCLVACAHAATNEQAAVLFGRPGTEHSLRGLTAANYPTIRDGGFAKNLSIRRINRLAIDSKVIVVEIDGKKYRFVGDVQLGSHPPIDHWVGESAEGDQAKISRQVESMLGTFKIGGRDFSFSGEGQYVVFAERSTKVPEPITPEHAKADMIAAEISRRKDEAAAKRVLTKAEHCEGLVKYIAEFDGYLRLQQAPHARRWLEETRSGALTQQRKLGC